MDASTVQMSMGDFLFYSIFGICLVFCVLICLIAVIKILMALTDKFENAKASTPATTVAAEPAAASAAPDRPLAPGTAGDLKLYDTDPRSAAMIMAIVADELGKPLNELRFISIKEVK